MDSQKRDIALHHTDASLLLLVELLMFAGLSLLLLLVDWAVSGIFVPVDME